MKFLATLLTVMILTAAPVLATDKDSAQAAMEKAKDDITLLAEKNISTFAANDLLEEAQLRYSRGDYNGTVSMAAQISAFTKSAIHASALMDEAETMIADLERDGVKTGKIKELLSASNAAFLRDDFTTAEARAEEATDLIADEQSKLSLKQTISQSQYYGLSAFFSAYWKETLAVLAVAAALAPRAWKKYKQDEAGNRASRLRQKKALTLKLMREAQTAHFVEGSTGRKEYNNTMKNYREQIAVIDRQLKTKRR